MELLPLGPVLVTDTPGLDDEGELGALRVEKARQVLGKTDIALLVVDACAGLSPEGQNDEEAANHELQATSEEEVLEEAVTSEETSSPVQSPAAPHTDNTIADAHSMKKVDDIRQAISIGDQFRFQRELFAGNGELMHKTIAKLNQMGSLDEAMKYLQAKFSWNAEDEIVEHFLQIIRRRW